VVPTIPPQSGAYVLSIIGGIGGSITMLSYNYWMREEGLEGSRDLGYVRGDIGVAYFFTAVFGMAILLIANQAFFVAGARLTDAQAVPRMSEMLATVIGPLGAWAYALGFWAAVFASLLGVWQSVPYLYADFYGILKKLPRESRRGLTRVTSRPYRAALVFITLVPLPFAFLGRPLVVIITYTIVGSLFVPFLAATLLYLNNRVRWPAQVPRNHWTTNVLLAVVLLVFLVLGLEEVRHAL
jgi:Mn2+/Fe2+ NRAMP family transporter